LAELEVLKYLPSCPYWADRQELETSRGNNILSMLLVPRVAKFK